MHWHEKALVALLLGVTFAGRVDVAEAQAAGGIRVSVVEEGTGVALSDVSVFLQGTGRSGLTNEDGRALFVGVPAGLWTVVVERIGYGTSSQEVRVAGDGTGEAAFRLNSSAVSMPAMVVTATREARPLSEVAAAVGIVGRSRLEEARPTHPSEIMGKVPGVWVNVTGGEGHMTAIRQPLGTNPVYLYLEDGVPTRSTGFFNHNALYEINLPQADRIEVMKGPANALYGSDAIGGVVNVETRAPSEGGSAEGQVELGAYGFARFLGSVSDRWGDDGIRVDGNYTRTDGWRDGTAYDRYSGTVRWDRQAGATSIKTVLAYSNIDQHTAGSSAISEADYTDVPTINYTPISFRTVTALRLSSALERNTAWGNVGVTAYVRSNTMDILPNWSLTYDPAVWETGNLSFGVLAKAQRDLPSVHGLVVAGVDVDVSPGYHKERLVSPSKDGKIFSSYALGDYFYDYDVTYRQASPYLHSEFGLTRAVRFTAGVRADMMGFAYTNNLPVEQSGSHRRPADASPSFAAVTPKLGLTARLTDDVSLFGAFRKGFRAPSEGQLFRQGSAANTVDLDPVRASSLEGGVRGRLGSRVRMDVSVYRMRVTDDILGFVLPDGSSENLNAGETLHRGIEVGLGMLLAPELNLDVAWSYAKHTYEEWSPRADVSYSGKEMLTAPRTIGNVELSWSPRAVPGLHLAAEWNKLGSYFTDQTNEHSYPGHDLFGARASFEAGAATLFLRANNLTDERYAESASYNAFRGAEFAPGMPRTLYMGVQVR